MCVSRFNSEGYFDPTPFEAFSRMEKQDQAIRAFWPMAYICSPYAGDIEKNVKAARIYSRFATANGFIPIAPHLLFPQFLNDSDYDERRLGLRFGNIMMDKCSEVWIFGERISAGMQSEITRAQRKSFILRYFTENCKEIYK